MRKVGKMADEEEGVGDSSSNLLLNVQRSVRELMRVALRSNENAALLRDAQTTLSDVPSLVQEKKRLHQEKIPCLVELELCRQLSEQPLGEASFSQGSQEDLEERVEQLEEEVAVVRARLSQDRQLLQRLQGSKVLTDHLFQRPSPSAEEKALQAVVVEHCGLSGEVGRVCVEVGEGEEEVGRVQKERRKSQARCRELVAKIEEQRKDPAGETSTNEIAKLKATLQLCCAECKMLRGCLQGVIVGSGVDWSGSPPLRDLTISLGHRASWELSS